jgi:hypothetical protein
MSSEKIELIFTPPEILEDIGPVDHGDEPIDRYVPSMVPDHGRQGARVGES